MEQQVSNYARFYGILRQGYKFATKELGDDFKAGVVSQFTDGRTTSLREMTRKEYDTMCDKLEEATGLLLRAAKEKRRKLRSRCLKQMQRLGMDTTDWTRINAFCEDARIAGKPFARLGNDELETLAVKLRTIGRKGGLKPKTRETQSPAAETVYVMPIGDTLHTC